MTDGNDMAYPIETGARLETGLSKREAFAMAALQGLLASDVSGLPVTIENYSEASVKYADALIAALNKPQETKE